MKFDIILPTIERDSLSRAIESVWDQTYTDWHLYLILDTNTVEGHVADHPAGKTTILCCKGPHHDSGTYARNFGIKNSSGLAGSEDWIAYIDCDDIWLPNHLTTIVEHVRMNPRTTMIHTAGQAFRWKHKHPRSTKLVRKLGEINYSDPMTVGTAHTRELFNLTPGWLPIDNHDHVLWKDLLLAGGVPAILPEITFEFER